MNSSKLLIFSGENAAEHFLDSLQRDVKLIYDNYISIYQIQTYLRIYGYDEAYFCIWTKKDTHIIIIIEYDHQLWLNMKSNLCKYYFDFYLKHLV